MSSESPFIDVANLKSPYLTARRQATTAVPPTTSAIMTATGPHVQVFTDVPADLVRVLAARLPRSITLFRRLQFTRLPAGKTEHARVVVASDAPLSASPRHFTATYLDPSRGRETNMWLYSTYEDSHGAQPCEPPLSDEDAAVCRRQILAVLHEARRIGRAYPEQPLPIPDHMLVGSLNDVVKDVAEANGVRFGPRQESGYEKFIFRLDELPEPGELPEGMVWGPGTWEDCEVAKSRTSIPRSV